MLMKPHGNHMEIPFPAITHVKIKLHSVKYVRCENGVKYVQS